MKEWTIDFAGDEFNLQTGKLAKQANGSVVVRCGDSQVLVTATMDDPRPGMNYFPLMVNYEERVYAIGQIPGSVMRREGRPRDEATLAARVIDRSIRPLFPDGYRRDVQIVATILSVDDDHDPEVLALNGASVALTLSDIPFAGPIGGVKVGLVEGEIVINPDEEERENSDLDLVVAGSKDAIMMVEASANEVSEEKILEAMDAAHEEIKKIISLQEDIREEAGKEKAPFESPTVDSEIQSQVDQILGDKMKEAIQIQEKKARNTRLDALKEELKNTINPDEDEEINDQLELAFEKMIKQSVKSLIIDDGVRPDGREYDEIRPIWAEVDFVPRAHGSGIFTRGETQALSVLTLGSARDEQTIFGLGENETKRYMHHYNFPSFCVGETSPMRSPGRREIGHGTLGEKALLPVIPSEEDFPYTIRIVSEVLESNGSSSQASICGSSLALMAAGVPIKAPVAGIAMGLMKKDDEIVVLSDIQGFEDFHGDMDFKVAGTKAGITALQMDMKLKGLSSEVLKEALEKAKKGRMHIMDKMLDVIPETRPELSENAPAIITMNIDPEKIRFVIGPGGKMINKIIDETGADIDIEDDGLVKIMTEDQEGGQKAKEMIERLTEEVEVGKIYQGKVKRIMNFGAFVEILPNKEGLVHISKLADHHVKEVGDVVSVGDEIPVKVIEIDNQDRINLSLKDAKKELEDNE
ncbi:polyribonucleotide nucleotidyltransferase [Halanaerobium saccharolyticum]|uniref:Polyribonucleotide nucleotidyltransferase n=1 Tax=Halanaerobium saccharolyticum TaxID=43595 RepID=A0A4R7Z6E3_9FIRM|nr:polyribonucleotide nucleotidyltransferase [Halanaerobium saccharolyticum]RAK11136.1 polyribonucleotide nucleotidyltransferase [Halanaerobium saccharolyticum]TDW06987.1 polyribonucleotide nucleotidyltransferase [Halanaerobium saccharolyticum]TDX63752.1 polyribonucleotide nucleotidyltransferase [Halanaerobium saccharolyticum]